MPLFKGRFTVSQNTKSNKPLSRFKYNKQQYFNPIEDINKIKCELKVSVDPYDKENLKNKEYLIFDKTSNILTCKTPKFQTNDLEKNNTCKDNSWEEPTNDTSRKSKACIKLNEQLKVETVISVMYIYSISMKDKQTICK